MHITSTRFHEPRCLELLHHAAAAVAIHGVADDGRVVHLGGLDDSLLRRLEVLATPASTAGVCRRGLIKRRAPQAGLPHTTCCHTFRATGITTCLPKVLFRGQNGGIIEHAQQIANHPLARTFGASPRTTRLYDRTDDAISLDERACPAVSGSERILI